MQGIQFDQPREAHHLRALQGHGTVRQDEDGHQAHPPEGVCRIHPLETVPQSGLEALQEAVPAIREGEEPVPGLRQEVGSL